MGKGFEWVLAMDGTPEHTWLAVAGMHLECTWKLHLEVQPPLLLLATCASRPTQTHCRLHSLPTQPNQCT